MQAGMEVIVGLQTSALTQIRKAVLAAACWPGADARAPCSLVAKLLGSK
jgi:hypothetical protein